MFHTKAIQIITKFLLNGALLGYLLIIPASEIASISEALFLGSNEGSSLSSQKDIENTNLQSQGSESRLQSEVNAPKNNYLSSEWVAIYVNLLLVFLTAALAKYTVGLYKAAIKTHEIAQDAHEAQHRTWIKITPIELGPITTGNDRVQTCITFEIEVVGTLPAIDIHVMSKPYKAYGFGIGRKELAELIAFEEATASMGVSLMPGGKRSCKHSQDASSSKELDAKSNQQRKSGVMEHNLIPTISIAYVVIYKSLVSKRWLHTGHVMIISGSEDIDIDPRIDKVFDLGKVKGTLVYTSIT